jgi:para-nitrobenzyl esterase
MQAMTARQSFRSNHPMRVRARRTRATRVATQSVGLAALLVAAVACSASGRTESEDSVDDTSALTAAGTTEGAPCIGTSWNDGQRVTVATKAGPVTGEVNQGVVSFLGIPYAKPPVGDLRFRPPVPPEPWDAAREATDAGAECPQNGAGSEDCLTVNVWMPATLPCGPLPVMVFIYGGGFTMGSSSDPLYNGQKLAARGVVLVSLNYRVGALGSLAHPALDAEDTVHHVSGNQGLLDQQLALRWVQANIGAFGGDPGRVTAFGESAGAVSLCAHMTSPLATGLFRAAIGESGPCTFLTTPIRDVPDSGHESAEALGERFAVALGCGDAGDADAAACMRSKTVSEVLGAIPNPPLINRTGASWGPIIDGYVLPRPPWDAFQDGTMQHVPYITGVNRDEGTLFGVGTTLGDDTHYRAAIAALVPNHVDDAVKLYSKAVYWTYRNAYDAFLTDVFFVCPARAQARAMAAFEPHTYLYSFQRENFIGWLSWLGVFHGSELPYVFDNFTPPFVGGAAEETLATAMGGYWTRFASGLDPNGAGAVAWPEYTAAGDAYLDLDDPISDGKALHAAACETVDPWLANP